MMSPIIEKHYPLFTSLVITVLGWIAFSHFPEIKLRYDIYSAAISISSILLGFLITTQSLLFAIDNSAVIQGLKQSGSYRQLCMYLMNAINTSFAAAVLNLVLLFVPIKDGLDRQPQDIYIFSIWLFIVSISIISTQRSVSLLNNLIQRYK